MLADHLDVVIGVDTHKDTHTAAVLSPTGAVLERLTVPADPRGYRRLIAFGEAQSTTRAWAIEGTGSFGAGLTAALLARCERVIEVDRPKRPTRRAGAKSDDIDAVRAAREVLSGDRAGEPRCRGRREAIRVLLTTPGSGHRVPHPRHRCVARFSGERPDEPAPAVPGADPRLAARHVRRPARFASPGRRGVRDDDGPASDGASSPGMSAGGRELETQLQALVRQVAPGLLDQVGIGAVVAAQVIVSWSHRGRVRSEAAFAQLAGVAPIPASSGQTNRHRLNHAGDRQLNRALHTVVMVRMRQDPTTKAYVARRLAEGKSIREIKRCLKRYVARQVFRQLEALPPPLDRT